MGTIGDFGYRCTIVLPNANIYFVEDVLNLLSIAVRNRDRHQLPQRSEPFVSRWNATSHTYSTHEASDRPSIIGVTSQADTILQSGLVPEQSTLIWDERTSQLKVSLTQRLYRAACSREIELWTPLCETVTEPPDNPDDIIRWATMASIFKADLLKFCERERVKVEFDVEDVQGDSKDNPPPSGPASQRERVAAPVIVNGLLNPPGKIPNVSIGRLAVSAAWEIELELCRPALPSEVIQRLQQWVETHEGDRLKPSDKRNCVKWETKKGKTKSYDLEACGAALRKWHASRADGKQSSTNPK